MIICLSSGSRERYRQDVILSLAMPKNYVLQFRYQSEEWVSPIAFKKFTNSSIMGETALIVYIDQSDKNRPPELVPCRLARITNSSIHGSTVSLQLSMQDFAYSNDIPAFNREIHSLSSGTIPNWDENKKPKGNYCIWIENNNLSTVITSNELRTWENIINQIAVRNDFFEERCFYMIDSILNVKTKEKIIPHNSMYILDPASEYELNIYHFHPSEGKSNAYLLCESQKPFLTSLTNTKLLINSRYDMKHYRFLTARTINNTRTVLSIFRGRGENINEIPLLDFDLNLQIKGIFIKKILLGLLIGLILATPHIITALNNTQLDTNTKFLFISVATLSSLAVGILASLNLKKDV
jgi:hypothetical protein